MFSKQGGYYDSVVYYYNPNTLAWEAGLQPVIDGSAITVSGPLAVLVDSFELTEISGLVNGSGNTVILTPASGKKIRLYYASYNVLGTGIEASFRFGVAGQKFLRNSIVVSGAIIAKDFGDRRYVQGATNEALYLNLTAGSIDVIWNAFYIEV